MPPWTVRHPHLSSRRPLLRSDQHLAQLDHPRCQHPDDVYAVSTTWTPTETFKPPDWMSTPPSSTVMPTSTTVIPPAIVAPPSQHPLHEVTFMPHRLRGQQRPAGPYTISAPPSTTVRPPVISAPPASTVRPPALICLLHFHRNSVRSLRQINTGRAQAPALMSNPPL